MSMLWVGLWLRGYLGSTRGKETGIISVPKGGRLPEEHISAEQQKPDLTLEIAYLLLIDVVGYSKLLVNEQIEFLQELNRIVRSTECFQAAEKNKRLVRVPTGDGM